MPPEIGEDGADHGDGSLKAAAAEEDAGEGDEIESEDDA